MSTFTHEQEEYQRRLLKSKVYAIDGLPQSWFHIRMWNNHKGDHLVTPYRNKGPHDTINHYEEI